jgi:hypothetical protein
LQSFVSALGSCLHENIHFNDDELNRKPESPQRFSVHSAQQANKGSLFTSKASEPLVFPHKTANAFIFMNIWQNFEISAFNTKKSNIVPQFLARNHS